MDSFTCLFLWCPFSRFLIMLYNIKILQAVQHCISCLTSYTLVCIVSIVQTVLQSEWLSDCNLQLLLRVCVQFLQWLHLLFFCFLSANASLNHAAVLTSNFCQCHHHIIQIQASTHYINGCCYIVVLLILSK